jgi:hypothetical protein
MFEHDCPERTNEVTGFARFIVASKAKVVWEMKQGSTRRSRRRSSTRRSRRRSSSSRSSSRSSRCGCDGFIV